MSSRSLPNGQAPGNSYLPEVEDPIVAWDPLTMHAEAASGSLFEVPIFPETLLEVRSRRQRLVAMEVMAARSRSEAHTARVALMEQNRKLASMRTTVPANHSSNRTTTSIENICSDEAILDAALRQSMLESDITTGSTGSASGVESADLMSANGWTTKPKKVSKKHEAIRATAESACESMLDVLLQDAALVAARIVVDEEEAARIAHKKKVAEERRRKLKEKREAEKKARKAKAIQRAVELAAANAAAAHDSQDSLGGEQQRMESLRHNSGILHGKTQIASGGGEHDTRSGSLATNSRREIMNPLGADDLRALKSQTPPLPPQQPPQQHSKSKKRMDKKQQQQQQTTMKSGLFDLLTSSPISNTRPLNGTKSDALGSKAPAHLSIGEPLLRKERQQQRQPRQQQQVGMQSDVQRFIDNGWSECVSPSDDNYLNENWDGVGLSGSIATAFSPITTPQAPDQQPPAFQLNEVVGNDNQTGHIKSSAPTRKQQTRAKKGQSTASYANKGQKFLQERYNDEGSQRNLDAPTRNLHVSSYGTEVTKDEIRALFEQHVDVLDVILKETSAGRYAFVNTKSVEGAMIARNVLAGSKHLRSKSGIKINFAKDRFAESGGSNVGSKTSAIRKRGKGGSGRGGGAGTSRVTSGRRGIPGGSNNGGVPKSSK
jgi:hypothetical protein